MLVAGKTVVGGLCSVPPVGAIRLVILVMMHSLSKVRSVATQILVLEVQSIDQGVEHLTISVKVSMNFVFF